MHNILKINLNKVFILTWLLIAIMLSSFGCMSKNNELSIQNNDKLDIYKYVTDTKIYQSINENTGYCLSTDMLTVIDSFDLDKVKRKEYLDKLQFYDANHNIIINDFVLYYGPVACYGMNDNLMGYEMNKCAILYVDEKGNIKKNTTINSYSIDRFGVLDINTRFNTNEGEETYNWLSYCIKSKVNKNNRGFVDVSYNRYIHENESEEFYGNYIDTELIKSKIYIKENGEIAKNEIINHSNKNYIFDNEQILVKNDTYEINNKRYLSNKFGEIVSQEGIYGYDENNNIKKFKKGMRSCYYVNKDGFVNTNSFFNYDNAVYFSKKNGELVRNAYIANDYYFDNYMRLVLSDVIVEDLSYMNMRVSLFDIKKESQALFKIASCSQIENYIVNDIKGNKIINKFVDYYLIDENRNCKGFVNNCGRLIKDTILYVDDVCYIVDVNGKILQNCKLYDREFYKNKNKRSEYNPYIKGYKVRRELIKPYLGYIINNLGELITKPYKFESYYMVHKATDAEDCSSYQCYTVENGKIDDKEIGYMLAELNERYNLFDEFAKYEYKEVDEGVYKCVHTKKGVGGNISLIDNNTLSEQLCRNVKLEKMLNEKTYYSGDTTLITGKNVSDLDETISFGEYYINDVKGEEKDKIRWDIIKKDENMCILITNKVIDYIEVNEYKNWLNNYFYYNAFNDEDKNNIILYNKLNNTDMVISYELYEKNKYIYNNYRNADETRYASIKRENIDNKNDYMPARPIICVKYNNIADNEYTNSNNDKCISVDSIENYIDYMDNLSDYVNNRGIKNDDGAADIDMFDSIMMGHIEQDNNLINGEEPIKWVILEKDEKNGKVLLLSKYVIDFHSFDCVKATDEPFDIYIGVGGYVTKNSDNSYSIFDGYMRKWEESRIRQWLNNDFIDLIFSEKEKNIIVSSNTTYDEKYINEDKSFDKLFLIDKDEVLHYFGDDYFLRTTDCSNYLKNKYEHLTYASWRDIGENNNRESLARCEYLLRSTHIENMLEEYGVWADCVSSENGMMDAGSTMGLCGVRPAMWVKYK